MTLYKKTMIFLGLFMGSTQVFAGEFQQGQNDPYGGIRYSQVFDQTKIYAKYQRLLKQLECAQNIFSSEQLSSSGGDRLDLLEIQKELKQFEQDCLAQLHQAHQIALAHPCIMTVSEIGMTLTTMWVAHYLSEKFKKEDTKTSNDGLSMFFSASSLIWYFRNFIKTGYNVLNPPDNILGELEDHFAKNKCYISNALWPKIITSFAAARAGGFDRAAHINFLTFVLNLTIYKPKVAITCKNNMSQEEVKQEIHTRIKTYFADYQECDMAESLINLQLNVAKFIDELMDHENMKTGSQGPRYLFLHGVGGIGKTHFVQTLASWIEELIPNSVRFEEIVVNSTDELEGNEQKPGAFLKILRNQLMQNKRGSVVMLDEATWLNDHGMINAAKRVFNGDRSKLSTSYFGSNIDGTAVALNIPPMLIFVASNDAINDAALQSRFDIVHYPKPTTQALITHALKIAEHSNTLKKLNINIDEAKITNWVQTLPENNGNFRYVAGNVESLLLQ